MTDDDRQYLTDQMALFEGGYEWVHLTFDLHLQGRSDRYQLGYTMREGYSGELIASQVPVSFNSLTNAGAVADEIMEIALVAREKINPF